MSFIQMHQVWNDIHTCHSHCELSIGENDNAITFFVHFQMFFIPVPGHIENFMKIDQKRFDLRSLASNYLARLQDSQKS